MLEEEKNVTAQEARGKPPNLGRSFVVLAGDARAMLARIRDAWRVVASWGTWRDEDAGEWPNREAALGALPAWLVEKWEAQPAFELENWFDDLHDREWVWWSAEERDGALKIDIDAEGAPISTWPLQFVVEAAGGRVIHRGDWVSPQEFADLIEKPHP
jgi:hypothetical protein